MKTTKQGRNPNLEKYYVKVSSCKLFSRVDSEGPPCSGWCYARTMHSDTLSDEDRLEEEELSEHRAYASSVRTNDRFWVPGINRQLPFPPLDVSFRDLCAFAVRLRLSAATRTAPKEGFSPRR